MEQNPAERPAVRILAVVSMRSGVRAGSLMQTDQFNMMFGTDYFRFEVEGLSGLVQEKADQSELTIIAVLAAVPGKGTFGRWLEEVRKAYQCVRVAAVWNPRFAVHLRRLGFQHEDWVVKGGETVEALVWRRK